LKPVFVSRKLKYLNFDIRDVRLFLNFRLSQKKRDIAEI
jgi:hypothetical protein